MTQQNAPKLVDQAPTRKTAPGRWRLANIIDGRALRVKLTAAALDNIGDPQETRKAALDILHGAMFRGRMIAQERLQQGADGLDTARLLAAVMDEVLGALYDFTTTHVFRASNPTDGERLSVMATGGYGRAVLAPSSDIDLLFLRPYKVSAHAESVIEFILYALWDMGLKVGHAFRTPEECVRLAAEDVTIKTSLLDARFLCGDEALAKTMLETFRDKAMKGQDGQFIADKLAERDGRHARQGDARYLVEPNVKEGKGGLRDLQTLYWIVKHDLRTNGGEQETLEQVMKDGGLTKHELAVFRRATRFLWSVRCHLHYVTGRAEERLSFDLQPELAARMGYRDRGDQLGVERFMKRYFLAAKDVGGLTRILAARLEAQKKAAPEGWRRLLPTGRKKQLKDEGFVIHAGRVDIAEPDRFETHPLDLIRLFVIADREGTDIHPDAMTAATRSIKSITRELRKTDDARALFLSALLDTDNAGRVLRQMNEAGVLGRIVPEFGGIVAQTQFNMYHHFTVDEHTIRAVEAIAALERGEMDDTMPRALDLFELIENRRALYLAMLLHDTGKGKGDQQVEGTRTSRAAAKRLGLPAAEVSLIGWLVGTHLEMSETAQKRDISDPRTIAKFAELVGSLERLRLLYILTVADIHAVGPGVWNAWKGQLLSELYHATAAALRGGRTDEAGVRAELAGRAEQRRMALQEQLGDIPRALLDMEDAYWTAFDVPDLAWHAAELDQGIATRMRPDEAGVSLFVSAEDRIGLFADLVGAIAGAGANIASAQVCTSPTGRVIDVFLLQNKDGTPFAGAEARRLNALKDAVHNAVNGDVREPELKARRNRRAAAFLVQPYVQIRNALSEDYTVVDVGGRDRPGLLYDLAKGFAAENISISSAHIGSYGERVFDAFYVQNGDGAKLTSDDAKSSLQSRLLTALGREEPDAPDTPVRKLKRASSAESY